jgi:hypothetical protein
MAIYANLTVDQGTDFDASVDVTDANGNGVDLSNYTYFGQVRKTYGSLTAVDFTITLDPNQYTLIIALSADQTNNMKPGRYVYDVEVRDELNITTRVLEGQLEVTPSVTRNN